MLFQSIKAILILSLFLVLIACALGEEVFADESTDFCINKKPVKVAFITESKRVFSQADRNARAFAIGWDFWRDSFVPRADDLFMITGYWGKEYPNKVVYDWADGSSTFAVERDVVLRNGNIYGLRYNGKADEIRPEWKQARYLDVACQLSESDIVVLSDTFHQIDYLTFSVLKNPLQAAILVNKLMPKYIGFFPDDLRVPKGIFDELRQGENQTEKDLANITFYSVFYENMCDYSGLLWLEVHAVTSGIAKNIGDKTVGLQGLIINCALSTENFNDIIAGKCSSLLSLWVTRDCSLSEASYIVHCENLEHLYCSYPYKYYKDLCRLKTYGGYRIFLKSIKCYGITRLDIFDNDEVSDEDFRVYRHLRWLSVNDLETDNCKFPKTIRSLTCVECKVTVESLGTLFKNLVEIHFCSIILENDVDYVNTSICIEYLYGGYAYPPSGERIFFSNSLKEIFLFCGDRWYVDRISSVTPTATLYHCPYVENSIRNDEANTSAKYTSVSKEISGFVCEGVGEAIRKRNWSEVEKMRNISSIHDFASMTSRIGALLELKGKQFLDERERLVSLWSSHVELIEEIQSQLQKREKAVAGGLIARIRYPELMKELDERHYKALCAIAEPPVIETDIKGEQYPPPYPRSCYLIKNTPSWERRLESLNIVSDVRDADRYREFYSNATLPNNDATLPFMFELFATGTQFDIDNEALRSMYRQYGDIARKQAMSSILTFKQGDDPEINELLYDVCSETRALESPHLFALVTEFALTWNKTELFYLLAAEEHQQMVYRTKVLGDPDSKNPPLSKDALFYRYFEEIVRYVKDNPLPKPSRENKLANKRVKAYPFTRWGNMAKIIVTSALIGIISVVVILIRRRKTA